MKFLGFFLLVLSGFGVYSTYRVLKYKELYRYYPSIRYRKDRGGYSTFLCYLTGGLSSIALIFIVFIALKIILAD